MSDHDCDECGLSGPHHSHIRGCSKHLGSVADQLIAAKEKITQLQKALDQVLASSNALAAKMEEIHSNDSFNGLFVFAKIHGQEYDGPNYEKEFEALKKALEELNE